jgi:methionine-rich copper-binding protein CopC
MGMMKITATLVLVAMVVATAMAHMALSKSMPEADAVMAGSPEHIQVWFTQAPDPAISQVTLEDGSGEVELGEMMIHDDKSVMTMVKTPLAPGTYTVRWRSAGDDGHTLRGEFTFSVKAAN